MRCETDLGRNQVGAGCIDRGGDSTPRLTRPCDYRAVVIR